MVLWCFKLTLGLYFLQVKSTETKAIPGIDIAPTNDIVVFKTDIMFIFLQVNSTETEAIPGIDIAPTNGIVVFQAGDISNYLQLQIKADNVRYK